MSQRPSILDDLGRELVRAARAQEAAGTRAGRLAGVPRTVVVGLLALLGLAAVAAAATLIIGRGAPIPAPPPGVVPAEMRPVAGSERLNALDVPDPDGGPAWDVRTSRGRTGAICATVGQVLDGELGLLGLDRRFRALPAGAADTCSRPQSRGATLAGARAFRGGGRLSAITVVSGVAVPSVRSAVAIAGERTVRMRLGRDHAFLAVLRGVPEELRPRIVLTEASGRRTTLRFADTGQFIAADPSGKAPWKLRYSTGRGGLRCVHAQRELGPDWVNLTAVPKRCGPHGAPFAAIRRFVPRIGRLHPPGRPGQLTRDPAILWFLHPARTVVWGSAPLAVGEVILTGAGAPMRLRVDRRGGARTAAGRGGFLAVLDGRVDPRRLRVSVAGRRLDPARALDPGGRAVGREPVPAWRSVASAMGRPRPPAPLVAVPGSVSILRAHDPTGGPGWALRSWSARSGANSSARTRLCFAIGVEAQGRLVEPAPGAKRRTVGAGWRDRVCRLPSALAAGTVEPEMRVYVDDAEAPDPRLVRVVVAGLLGDGVRSAELLGAGAPRALALGRHGTFLIVLGPEHAGAPLRVRGRRANGVSRTSRVLGQFRSSRCVPTPGRSVRVADPDGGPSWVAGSGRVAGRACRYVGRAIGGDVGIALDGLNQVILEPQDVVILSTARPRPKDRPLTLRITDPRIVSFGQLRPTPSSAQVARRTLRGRTVLRGTATADATSITLRTPRDVRTVRPGPGGQILAVYDGAFYGGQIHATVRLRDGRTITQTLPIGYR